MNIPQLPEPVSVQAARQHQNKLREKIALDVPIKKVKIIAGTDVSMDKGSHVGYAGVVCLSYPELEVLESTGVAGQLSFPYVPGFLAYREAPLLLKAIRQLKTVPDLFLFDGHGIAHPRGIGLASHVGLYIQKPSIGCAKSKLTGEYADPPSAKGERSELFNKNGKVIGCVLRSRDGCKPLFVSQGHLSNLGDAARIVLGCCRRYRIPEPTRQAHILVNQLRKQEKKYF